VEAIAKRLLPMASLDRLRRASVKTERKGGRREKETPEENPRKKSKNFILCRAEAQSVPDQGGVRL